MATIGGLSNGTSSGVNMYGSSIKGVGGLASGLDTDSMIEGMTLGTRTKIEQLLKKKTTYQWQMDSYRSITDKLISFNTKYLNIAAANSPYRASFFDKSLVTLKGENSKYISVNGASSGLESMTVLGIKQLARDTSMVSSGYGSVRTLNTGAVSSEVFNSNLNGGSFSLEYDENIYTFNLNQGSKFVYLDQGSGEYKEMTANFNTPDDVVKTMNAMLNSVDIQKGTDKLGTKVEFTTQTDADGNTKFSLKRLDGADSTESMTIASGSATVLKAFGFLDSENKLINQGLITPGGTFEGEKADIGGPQTLAEFMAGKKMTFNYNGVTKSITFPRSGETGYVPDLDAAGLAGYLNNQLGKAFGTGKITVSENGGVLSFKTADESSVFRIADADKGIMGKSGLLGIGYATTNRLNREDSLANSGLDGIPKHFGAYEIDPGTGKRIYVATVNGEDTGLGTLYNDKGELLIKINGTKVEGLTVDSSLLQVTSKINASDAGAQISYVETADCFSMKATNHGEAGKLEFGEVGNASGPEDFMKLMFGGGYAKVDGLDSIMEVKYEGNAKMEIRRDTNSFNLDGSTFTLNEIFGYKKLADGSFEAVPGTEEISFSTSVDTEKITKVITTMISDYNAILEESYKQVSTKPDRSYGPLSDDQKSKLTADEIKKLEDKAKEGILFNDPLLRSLSEQLRSVFSGTADVGTLKNMGIIMSSDYGDNGKISFDEEAFKKSLLENPDKVKELFTKPVTDESKGGFSTRLKTIADAFAKKDGVPKGSLVEKAGTASSATSVLNNALQKLMNDIDKQVDTLKDKLKTEIDRYTRQFSSLEQLVSQMNAQSSWLSSALG